MFVLVASCTLQRVNLISATILNHSKMNLNRLYLLRCRPMVDASPIFIPVKKNQVFTFHRKCSLKINFLSARMKLEISSLDWTPHSSRRIVFLGKI